MKKLIIPFTLFASITFLAGNIVLAQDNVPVQNNDTVEIEEGKSGYEDPLINFNAIENSNNDFLKIKNWTVSLNPSSSYISNKQRTYPKKVSNVKGSKIFLGIRGNFPKVNTNGFVTVKPRYGVSFYGQDNLPIAKAAGLGVIPNVGTIRGVVARVAGRNYNHLFMVKMKKNIDEKILNLNFGPLSFFGWKELEWKNPNYLQDYRDRESIITPLYPRIVPSLKFDSIVIFRNSTNTIPGNFIGYVDYINVHYDKALISEGKDDEDYIEDESMWNILKNENGGLKNALLQEKINNFRCLERTEKIKSNMLSDEERQAENPCLPKKTNKNPSTNDNNSIFQPENTDITPVQNAPAENNNGQ